MKSFEKNKNNNTDIEISSIEEESEIKLSVNTNSKAELKDAIQINEVSELEINNEEIAETEIEPKIEPKTETKVAAETVDNQLKVLASQIQNEDKIQDENIPQSKKINTFTKNIKLDTKNNTLYKSSNVIVKNDDKVVEKGATKQKNTKINTKKTAVNISSDRNKTNISKNEKAVINNKKHDITTSLSVSHKNTHQTANSSNNSNKIMFNGNKAIENLKNMLPEYELPRMVSASLFLIGLMIIVCITLMVSINNRNIKLTNTGVSKKTYISPIFEGAKEDSVNSYSYEQNPFSLPYITSSETITSSENIVSNPILSEINALQNVENIEISENDAEVDITDLNDSAGDTADINHDQNNERLDYLLKSYVIISPSVDPSVNQLFAEYFDARMNVDLEKYLSLFGYDTSKLNVDSFGSLKRSLEYERSLISMISNVKIYLCSGFDSNEKICFVNYDMVLRYANAIIPSVFYANIVLIGDRYYIQPHLDAYRQVYVDHIIKQEEIRSLNYNVRTRLNTVLENNDFARIVYVSLRDKQFKIEDIAVNNTDEFGSYTIQDNGGVFSTAEPVNKVVLDDLRSQVPYDSIPAYHGLLTDPLLK